MDHKERMEEGMRLLLIAVSWLLVYTPHSPDEEVRERLEVIIDGMNSLVEQEFD